VQAGEQVGGGGVELRLGGGGAGAEAHEEIVAEVLEQDQALFRVRC
jgi:hypothetical protein